MQPLTRDDLLTLESYAQKRDTFREKVMDHKRNRRIALGPHLTLYFEDRLTIQYQIQEMLRVERIFEPAAIEEELRAYNPLIPDAGNLKATMMIEFEDAQIRRRELEKLVGIEERVWCSVGAASKRFAIADEDMERQTEKKTSAVHFLRFQLLSDDRKNFMAGEKVALGVDHDQYRYEINPVPERIRGALLADIT